MNNIDLIKYYKPETKLNIILANQTKIMLKVGDLVDDFYESRFIGFKLPQDKITHFINMQSIESINIINEQN